MNLQARLLLVYSVLFVGAVVFLVFQRNLDIFRSQTVLAHELTNHKSYFDKLMALEGDQINSLATDYSYWDEMVNFVKHPTKDWAVQNIDTGVSTFNADAAWVYDPGGKLVYFSSVDQDTSAKDIALPPQAFTKIESDRSGHFYVKEPDGVMEIRAATIVPTSDFDHATTPQGYWLVGRYINDSYLKKMADLSQSTIVLNSASASTLDATTNNSVSFATILPGWNGGSLGVLRLTAPVPVEKDLENLYNRQLMLLALFFIASALLVVSSMWWFVLRPVRAIAGAIQKQEPNRLNGLATESSEFGHLAGIVQLSFRQTIKIAESEFLKTKLEELNQAKSEFLAIAAHELRGPVGNVNIFSENLSDLIEEDKVGKDMLHDEIGRISQQAHRANVLINDMYQASKGGRALDFEKKEFDFDKFVLSEVENARLSTNQKIELEGQTGQTVVSDPDRLSQVMSNLIRNAAKYSSTHKSIIVRLSFANNELRVEVQDFGLGISPEDQPKLFQRFYRSAAVSKDYPGLGLGLSVCKDIVEGLGGKIWLTSELGVGSHFYFSLPVSPRQQELS